MSRCCCSGWHKCHLGRGKEGSGREKGVERKGIQDQILEGKAERYRETKIKEKYIAMRDGEVGVATRMSQTPGKPEAPRTQQ